MLQLLPSFSRLSLGSLKHRSRVPTDAGDVPSDAAEVLLAISRGTVPTPSRPERERSASGPRVAEELLALAHTIDPKPKTPSMTPGAQYARNRRKEQKQLKEQTKTLEAPTAPPFGQPRRWTEDEKKRLKEIFLSTRARGSTQLNVAEIVKSYNVGLPEYFQRNRASIQGLLRRWIEEMRKNAAEVTLDSLMQSDTPLHSDAEDVDS